MLLLPDEHFLHRCAWTETLSLNFMKLWWNSYVILAAKPVQCSGSVPSSKISHFQLLPIMAYHIPIPKRLVFAVLVGFFSHTFQQCFGSWPSLRWIYLNVNYQKWFGEISYKPKIYKWKREMVSLGDTKTAICSLSKFLNWNPMSLSSLCSVKYGKLFFPYLTQAYSRNAIFC